MTVRKWLGTSSNSWSDAANWSGDAVPGAADSVVIEPGASNGQYSITIDSAVQVASLLLDVGGAVLSVGDLTQDGSLSAAWLDFKAGTLALADGTLTGTVTAGRFGFFQFDYGYYGASGGTLNDVAWRGNFEPILTGIDNSQYLDISGSLTLAGANGSGPGTALLQNGASLDFLGTQTLNNATVTIGGVDPSTGAVCAIESTATANAAASLTFGSALDLKVVGPTHLTTSGAITNDGTITAKGGLLIEGTGTFTNAGLIEVSGQTYEAIGHFVNTGTIDVTGGTLTLTQSAASTWSNTGVIDASNGSVFLAGTVTASQLTSFEASNGGTLGLAGTLLNAGNTLSLGTGGLPSLVLAKGGVIDGGTVEGVADVTLKGGTLASVTWDGNIDLSSEGTTLTIRNKIKLAPSAQSTGTIAVTGLGAEVIFANSVTLANSAVVLGTEAYSAADYLLVGSDGAATTLTLGASSSLQLLNGATITGDALVNDGLIDGSAGSLTLQSFTNAGLIDFNRSNQGFINLQIGNFTNSGTLIVGNQAELDFYAPPDGPDQTWASTGQVNVSNATLTIGGTLTTASLNTVHPGTGGEIDLDGVVKNGGAILDLANFSSGTLSLGGTIAGGTLAANGATLAIGYLNAVFSGVTVQGDLDLTASDATLQITGGLTLDPGSASAGTLNAVGTQVNFVGSQSVAGGAIAFSAIDVLTDNSGLGTLDLNPQSALIQGQLNASLSNGGYGTPLTTVVNGSLIDAGFAAGAFSISNIDLVNYVEFVANNGDSVQLSGGTFTNAGVLSLAGMGTSFTLGYGSATAFTNSALITIAGGILNDGDPGASLDTGNSWTNTGTVKVDGGLLRLDAAYTTAGLGTILVSDGGSVELRGDLDNSDATLTLGKGTALGGLSLTYGTITGGTIVDLGGGIVAHGGVLDGVTYDGVLDLSAASATLGIAGGITLHGANGQGTSSILLTGAGSALIFAGGDSETLNNTTLEFGASDTLTSNINGFSSATTLNLGSELTIAQAQNARFAGTGLIVNDTSLQGTSSTGTIGISTALFTNAATFAVLAGEQGTFSGVVFSNTGVMDIGNGSVFTLEPAANQHTASPALSNAGSLHLINGTLAAPVVATAAPSLSNASSGVIFGSGTITGSLANAGTIAAAGGTLTLQQAVSGQGILQAKAGATLVLAGAVSSSETAQFAGANATIGLAPMAFLGEIGGIASGERLDLLQTEASAASFSGSSIVVTLSTGGTLVLDTTTALTGTITAATGTHGDTVLTFGGVHAGTVSPTQIAHVSIWPVLQTH